MYTCTKHAHARIRQRGMREQDVEFILNHGTENGDRVFLSARDADALILKAKKMIAAAERLKNKMVVIRDGKVITAFTADRRQLHNVAHS